MLIDILNRVVNRETEERNRVERETSRSAWKGDSVELRRPQQALATVSAAQAQLAAQAYSPR